MERIRTAATSGGLSFPGRRSYWRCGALVLLMVAGCAERGTVLTGGPSTSQLKTSLSHLQFENEQLKTQVAKLKEESRSLEDRLVQEQIHNGDLTARLDDARNILRDRGLGGTMVGSRSKSRVGSDPDEEIAQPRTLPAGRTRKPRKPPAASIPGDLESLPTAAEDADSQTGTISLRSPSYHSRRPSFPDDPPLSISDDQLSWQPVATAPSQSIPRK